PFLIGFEAALYARNALQAPPHGGRPIREAHLHFERPCRARAAATRSSRGLVFVKINIVNKTSAVPWNRAEHTIITPGVALARAIEVETKFVKASTRPACATRTQVHAIVVHAIGRAAGRLRAGVIDVNVHIGSERITRVPRNRTDNRKGVGSQISRGVR